MGGGKGGVETHGQLHNIVIMIHEEENKYATQDGKIFVHYLALIMFEFIHYANIFLIRQNERTWTAPSPLDLPLAPYLCITFSPTGCCRLSVENKGHCWKLTGSG